MSITCTVCGKPNPEHIFHYTEHYHCADCGATERLCTYTEKLVLCEPCHEKRVKKRIATFRGETDFTPEITCPHCGHVKSDSWECAEGERECGDCGRTYDVIRNVEVTYSTTKVKAKA